jgi:CubicO group peptidase (beta-lactamase class C family)
MLLLSGPGFPQRADPEKKIDALLGKFEESPGVAVGVVRDGRSVLIKTSGYADVAKGIRITPGTAFDLASVSKQFTATAIMQLAEQSRLRYDDPITQYLPELPESASRITLRDLLNHTSGLPHYEVLCLKEGKIKWDPRSGSTKPDDYEPTAAEVVKLIGRHFETGFTPGSQFEYSNTGYVLLGQILERVSGMRLAQYLEANVFEPAGMVHAVLRDERLQPVANRALSYATAKAKTDMDYTPLNLIYGDGNINATIDDMIHYAIALQGGKLLTSESSQLAFTAPTLSRGSSRYGFGWWIGEVRREPFYHHEGAWVGFRSAIADLPKHRLTVIVLANFAEADTSLAKRVAELYLP